MHEHLTAAIILAAESHRGQVDKAGHPYILHVLSVMEGCHTIEMKIVAALHDIVEDTPVTLEELREFGFTEEIVEAVDAVTRRKGEEYMDFIDRAAKNKLGRLVKYYDVVDHLNRKENIPESLSKRYEKAYEILYPEIEDTR